MAKNLNKIKAVKSNKKMFEVPVRLDSDTFYLIKAMAKSDCRSVSQQIRFLMLLGKDFVTYANGMITRHSNDTKSEDTELESAIGFKIGE